jgi:hypothetical protein
MMDSPDSELSELQESMCLRMALGYVRRKARMRASKWTPRVRKSGWKICESCQCLIPFERDLCLKGLGATEYLDTWTAVCPFCKHVHVGTPFDFDLIHLQKTCHACGTALGDQYQCPECKYPRGWTDVRCRYCHNQQPVFAPHWVAHCDWYLLQCVLCELVSESLCIC